MSRGKGIKAVLRFCPVPPLRNEDARHVLRDGTIMRFCGFKSKTARLQDSKTI